MLMNYCDRWTAYGANHRLQMLNGSFFQIVQGWFISLIFSYATVLKYHYRFVLYLSEWVYGEVFKFHHQKVEIKGVWLVMSIILSVIWIIVQPLLSLITGFRIAIFSKNKKWPGIRIGSNTFMNGIKFSAAMLNYFTFGFYMQSKDLDSLTQILRTKTFWRDLLSQIDGIKTAKLVAESTENKLTVHGNIVGKLIFKLDTGAFGAGSGIFDCHNKEELYRVMTKQQQKCPAKYLVLNMETFYHNKKAVYHIQTLCDQKLNATVVSVWAKFDFEDTSHDAGLRYLYLDPITMQPNGDSEMDEMLSYIKGCKGRLELAILKALEAHKKLRSMDHVSHCYVGWDVMINENKEIIFFEGNPSSPRLWRDAVGHGWLAAVLAFKRLAECYTV